MSDHYQTLGVRPSATHAQVKAAYRRLVKLCHPDTNPQGHERMIALNLAYEVLGDPAQRRTYDQQKTGTLPSPPPSPPPQLWWQEVFQPVDQRVRRILVTRRQQLDRLAADPFDDECMAAFSQYLGACRRTLQQAETLFRSQASPPALAGVASGLYHCLNHLQDALEDLHWFTQSYSEQYLQTSEALFRRAGEQRQRAWQAARWAGFS
ncbi:DnaJ-class molecular chaperone [Gloeomargarita lithophora Alchichica-D10]|uniref:DnaJ-class molecular chaperone n=1 Tax=Gloeomargarita lithophora Alchichica-D10 TaxID=1188229 RepID=A0A1J0AEG6_9CYAN|nr:J domain-containing protein [Gloeomargarita lithophora]APB34291.1 DnaJ-class molecular chaperone [Gloeomargarita lithophora Alchichica-D10]